MYAAYRLTSSILVIFSLLFYFGCSSSSNTSRYGGNSNNSDHPKDRGRFSSENDNNTGGNNDESYTYVETDDTEDLPDDDEVDFSSVIEKYNPDANELINERGTTKERMLMGIIKYLDTPYKYGGNSKKGIDCSAFTQTIYKSVLSVDLSRSAHDQFNQGEAINDMDDLMFGDLVFFDTRSGVRPGHVGIYIGDNLFAHASSKKGVTISSLTHSYYHERFMGGRRIKPVDSF